MYFSYTLLFILILCGYLYLYEYEHQLMVGDQHRQQVADFKQQLRSLESEQHSRDRDLRLHDLYYSGVSDHYDYVGTRLSGVAPNPTLAINHLKSAIYLTRPHDPLKPKLMLKLADLYASGMHKYQPNLPLAMKLYLEIIKTYPSFALEARERYNRVAEELYRQQLYGWLNLPDPRISNQPTVTPLNPLNPSNHVTPKTIKSISDVLNNLQKEKVRDDKQNTHNSTVVSTVAKSINNLLSEESLSNNPYFSLEEVRQFIRSLPESDRRKDAIASLSAIESSKDPIGTTQLTGAEALDLVWRRINHNPKYTPEQRANLRESLYHRLADMQEHGHTVCATGRFDRIIDTLSGIDEMVSIKPTYLIREEMMNKAALVRNQYIKQYITNIGSDTTDEQDEAIRQAISNTLYNDYVQTGIITADRFNAEMGEWLNCV